MKERIKRKLAMFLAVCLVLTSFQGVAWADSESESRDVTIALSGEKIREAAENAIRSGFLYENQYSFENADSDEAGEPESYKNLFDGSTGSVFVLDEIPYANEASASEAIPDDAELQMFVKISEEAKAERASKSEADRASSSETAIDTANYELRGDETIIFLFINRSNDELNFQLDIDGRKSGIVTVESGSSLLSEEETVPAEETAAEELETEEAGPGGEVPDAEAPADGSNGGVSGGSSSDGSSLTEDETNPADESQAADTETDENGSADENGSEAEDKPENNTPDAGDIHTGNETVTDSKDQTESSENTNTSGSESAGKPEDKETTQPEASDNNSSSDEDQKNGGNENQSGSAETGDTGSESSDSSEAGSHSDSGSSEEKSSSGSEGNSGSDSSSEKGSAGSSGSGSSEKGSDSSSGGGSSSDSSSDVQVSMSSYSVPRVMSINGPSGIDGGDEEDEDMDFEDWQDMQPDDEDEDDEESCDDDVMTYSDSYDGVDLAAEVLPTVLVKRNRVRLFRALFGENATSAAVMTASLDSLTRAAEVNFDEFTVNLYDYDPNEVNALIGKPQGWDNDSNLFLIQQPGDDGTRKNYNYQNTWLGRYSAVVKNSAFQGIVADTYNAAGYIQLKAPYTTGDRMDFHELFTDNETGKNGIYPKIGVKIGEGVFQKEGNYYVLNAAQSGSDYLGNVIRVSLDTEKDASGNTVYTLNKSNTTSEGFFPFDYWTVNNSEHSRGSVSKKNEAFAMKMSFDFHMPENGKLSDTEDMEFTFAGDDDVWVYLREKGADKSTSKLVLDLGGIHGLTRGSINFATGTVTHNSVYKNDTTAETVTWNLYDRISRDYSDYTLDFYFMERGGNSSNCYIAFNMPVIPKKGIKIQKQVQGKADMLPAAGTEFKFNVVYSENREDLLSYKNKVSSSGVEIAPVTIQGAGANQIELDPGMYFYIEETGEAKSNTVSWEISGAQSGTAAGDQTEIYQVPEQGEGILVQCTNTYGALNPTISKSAWMDEQAAGDSIYDIALQVSGDSMTTVEGQGSGANVLYVLDNSYSMREGSRMRDLKNAIETSLNSLKDKNGVSVAMFAYDDDINAQFKNGDWTELNDTSLAELTEFYENLNYQGITSNTGNTNSARAFEKALEVFGKTKNNAKKYLIFVTDGDPCPYNSSADDGYEINARKAGDALRKTYGTDELSIFMIGVGDSLKNDWWMNPESSKGKPSGQTNVTYPTSYHHVQKSSDLSNLFEELTNEITTTTYITNPKVTDTLSGYVSPANVGAATDVPMTLWLYNGKLGEDGVTAEVKAQSEKLTGTTSNGVVTYTTSDETEVAKYYVNGVGSEGDVDYIPAKTLVWTVAAELSSDQTKTLIYRVKVTGAYDENEFVYPDKNTGTHSIEGQVEKGYHSNERAVLTYNGDGEKEFLHPVVRPSIPSGSLKIKKIVEGDVYKELSDNDKPEFEFTITLSNVSASEIVIKNPDGTEITKQKENDYQDGSLKLTVSLKGNEELEITGLNKETEYTVKESSYNEDEYYSGLKSIEVLKDGQADTAGVELEKRQISGNLMNTGNGGMVTQYGYKESVSVDTDDKIVMGNSETLTNEAGENGWYDKDGKLIPEDAKTVGGVIEKKTEEGATTYTWEYPEGNKVSATAGDSNGIASAQSTIENALNGDGYTEQIVKESTAPYTVSAKKKINEKQVTLTQTYYAFSGWQWDTALETEYPDYIVDENSYEYGDGYWINISLKRNVKVNIYKLDTKSVSATSETSLATDYWEYSGTKYTSTADLKTKLENDGYTVTESGGTIWYSKDVPKTNQQLFEEGYRYREYFTREVAASGSLKPLKVEATYTNTFDIKDNIIVEKVVSFDPGVTVPAGEVYKFKVQKLESGITDSFVDFNDYTVVVLSGNAEKEQGAEFTIAGAGKVKLLIGKNSSGKNARFRVIESDKAHADASVWGVSGENSGAVENGSSVTCTNYYYNNTLQISKTLSSGSYSGAPEAVKKFKYEVTLKDKDNNALSSVKYDTTSNGVTFANGIASEGTITLENGKFEFLMDADGHLDLSLIPTGAKYEVKEVSFADADLGAYYEFELTGVTQNGTAVTVPADKTISGAYTDGTKNQTVGFENKLKPKMSQITVRKEIADADKKAAKGETFIFKISNGDKNSVGYGDVFYVALEIGGDGTASKTLNVPYGTYYEVAEEEQLYYEQTSVTQNGIVKTISGEDTVTFTNKKTENKYFSDASTKVNTVDKKTGFPKTDSAQNRKSVLSSLAWDPLGSKDKEKESDEN